MKISTLRTAIVWLALTSVVFNAERALSQSIQDSIQLYKEQIGKLDKTPAIGKHVVIQLQARLGDAYLKTNDIAQAEAAYLEGMAMLEQGSNKQGNLSQWLIVRLARVYRVTKQNDLAWDLLTTAFDEIRYGDKPSFLLMAMLTHERGLLAKEKPRESGYRDNGYDSEYNDQYRSDGYSGGYQSDGSYGNESSDDQDYQGSDDNGEFSGTSRSNLQRATRVSSSDTEPDELLWRSYILYQNCKGVPAERVSEVVTALGKIYSEKGRTRDGMALLRSFLDYLSTSTADAELIRREIRGALAGMLYKEERYEEALDEYTKLVESPTTNTTSDRILTAEYLGRLTEIYAKQNQSAKAAEYAARSLRLASELYGAKSTKVGILMKGAADAQLSTGDTTAAIATLEKQISLLQDSAAITYNSLMESELRLGRILLNRGNIDKAEELYSSAIQKSRSYSVDLQLSGTAMISLAEIRARQRNINQADSLLTAGLRVIPNTTAGYYDAVVLAASIKEQLGDDEEAIELYQAALESLNPSFRSGSENIPIDVIVGVTTIAERMVHLFVKVGQDARALNISEQVVEFDNRYQDRLSDRRSMMFRHVHLYSKLYFKAFQTTPNDDGYRRERYREYNRDSEKIHVVLRKIHDSFEAVQLPSAKEKLLYADVLLDAAILQNDQQRADSLLTAMIEAARESDIVSVDTLIYYYTLQAISSCAKGATDKAKPALQQAETLLEKAALTERQTQLHRARIDKAYGDLFLRQKNVDSAALRYSLATETYGLLSNPPNQELALAHLGLALTYYEQGDFSRASIQFERVVELDLPWVVLESSSSNTLLVYARCLASIFDFDKSKMIYKRYIKQLQQKDGRYNQVLLAPLTELLALYGDTDDKEEAGEVQDYIDQIKRGLYD